MIGVDPSTGPLELVGQGLGVRGVRKFRIYTAPLGPRIEGTINKLKPLLRIANRKITKVRELGRNGFGKLLGIELTHSRKTPLPEQWHYQDVYVNAFGNPFRQAGEVIRFQQLADNELLDVEIIQQIGIGKITGLRLYFSGE